MIKILDTYYQKVEETDLQVLLHTHYSHPQIHGHFHIHLLRAEEKEDYFILVYGTQFLTSTSSRLSTYKKQVTMDNASFSIYYIVNWD